MSVLGSQTEQSKIDCYTEKDFHEMQQKWHYNSNRIWATATQV